MKDKGVATQAEVAKVVMKQKSSQTRYEEENEDEYLHIPNIHTCTYSDDGINMV